MPDLPPRAPTFPSFINKLPEEMAQSTPSTTSTDTAPKLGNTYPSPSPLVDMSPEVATQIDEVQDLSSTKPTELPSQSTTTSTSTNTTDVPVAPLPVAPRRSRIRAILLWRDPKISALCLSSFLLFFYLTLIRGLSVLSVIGALFGGYLAIGFTTTNLNKYLGGKLDKYIARPPPGTPLFKKEILIRYLDFIIDEGNDVAEEIRDILYCDKPSITFAWMAVAFFIFIAGKFCSLLSVLLITVLAAFSLPLLYEKNKKQVDDAAAKASSAVSRQLETGKRVLGERAVKLRDMAAEKSAPMLEKAPPVARDFAKKIGLAPKQS